jgi:sirohydrochlorin cobaltochelatase
MREDTRGVILVGHGAVPKDFPRDAVSRLKALEARRKASGTPPSEEEVEIEARIRSWPRTSDNDPYQAGLEALGLRLLPLLGGAPFALAYNEFCAPTLAEAVRELIARGAREITVIPSMLTPGGVHSEIEIPEEIARLRAAHPGVLLHYAWPFDLGRVARMLAAQLSGAERSPGFVP